MVYIKKQQGQSDDQVIRAFSRLAMDEDIVGESKRRKFYLKPSQARKLRKKLRQAAAARIRVR